MHNQASITKAVSLLLVLVPNFLCSKVDFVHQIMPILKKNCA